MRLAELTKHKPQPQSRCLNTREAKTTHPELQCQIVHRWVSRRPCTIRRPAKPTRKKLHTHHKEAARHTQKYPHEQEISPSPITSRCQRPNKYCLGPWPISPSAPSYLPSCQVRPHARSCPKAISSVGKHNGSGGGDPRVPEREAGRDSGEWWWRWW